MEELKAEALHECAAQFARIDAVSLKNTEKVLTAYKEARVSAFHFAGTSGYGYNDPGRRSWMKCLPAFLRRKRPLSGRISFPGRMPWQPFSARFLKREYAGFLVGAPYDTMQGVIGYDRDSRNSLKKGASFTGSAPAGQHL